MKKSFLAVVLVIIAFSAINAQENKEGNYFQNNFQQRIILGLYDSYYADNIGFVRGGYEAVLELIHITPEYNLIDF
jgi:hypothetical protein